VSVSLAVTKAVRVHTAICQLYASFNLLRNLSTGMLTGLYGKLARVNKCAV